MPWLNNAWVIGIATSVVSGLLVTWAARILISKKEDREYRQRVMAANRDIIYAVRGGVAEGKLSQRDVVLALTEATARRYDVLVGDLYKPKEIAQELIREIMDSSFLPTEKKVEYCAMLVEFGKEAPMSADVAKDLLLKRSMLMEKTVAQMSIVFGVMAAGVSLVAVLFQWKELRIGEHLLALGKGVGWFFLGLLALAIFFKFLEFFVRPSKQLLVKKTSSEEKKSGSP